MTASQIFTPEFISKLAGAADRFYDSERGEFQPGYEQFHKSAGQAALVVAAAESLGLDAAVVGTSSLPEHTMHPEGPDSGYDWAIVDNRWVVDLWRHSYHGEGRILYDLNDPEQKQIAESNFGPAAQWALVPMGAEEMDTARRIWHEFTAPYDAVDNLLGGVTERKSASLESCGLGKPNAGSSPVPSAIVSALLESPTIKTLEKTKQPLSPEEQAQVDAVKLNHGDCASWWKAEHEGKTWYVVHTHRAGQVRPTLKSALKVFPAVASTA